MKKMRKWHLAVCERAGWKCEICGKWGDEQTLCGHHIKTKGAYPELKYDVDNGLCVCNTPSKFNSGNGCHNMIHLGHFKVYKNGEIKI